VTTADVLWFQETGVAVLVKRFLALTFVGFSVGTQIRHSGSLIKANFHKATTAAVFKRQKADAGPVTLLSIGTSVTPPNRARK
jgi:hypothetical protein